MSNEEQQTFKEKQYAEAMRYMDNAKETLKNAKKEGSRYQDKKYVRTACGTAYNGTLLALDAYLKLKGVEKTKGRKSIEFYQEQLAKQDKKLLGALNNAYQILHLYAYYDGLDMVIMVKAGFDCAYEIINKIKPS
jgi:hypothetical protein